jgi:hypothetical protein
MPRYFFHVRGTSGYLEDPEGRLLPNLDAARGTALREVRQLVGSEAKNGAIDLTDTLEIADEHGTMLAALTFRSAFDLRL